MESVAARACEKISDMLAAGPRSAAEILAAAEGANVSERSIQRAAVDLGVVKTRAAFRSGWTWALPECEGAKEVVEITHTATGNNSATAGRAKVIADRLRKLEAGRGKTAPIYSKDSRLLRWVQAGISDPQLREAYEMAVFDLETERSQSPINAGFLDRFVDQVINSAAG